MPGDDVAHSLDEGIRVARPREPCRERDVVDRIGAVDAVLEPHPQLRRRHLQRPLVRDGYEPWTLRGEIRCRVDAFGQLGHRTQLEDLPNADVGVALRAHRGNEFGGQQGVAAEVEERIVGTDPVAAEQLGVQVGDAPLGALGGFPVLGAGTGPGVDVRLRQRGTVDLAVRW